MTESIRHVQIESVNSSCIWDKDFTLNTARRTRKFHSSIPSYFPTPLVRLDSLAKKLGLASIHVKDESKRFALNAFKCLGGSWCIANYVAEALKIPESELTFERLTRPDVKAALGDTHFVTATDGNHGRGVAWTASRLGLKSVVFMPKGSAPERLANIQAWGAEASITDVNYDDTVKLAKDFAETNGWPLIQDTSFHSYEAIPLRIMQGYLTMALEIVDELPKVPTHLFIQAGLGSLAGALAGFFADYYGPSKPVITIIEPHNANCLFRTAEAHDGHIHTVTGDLKTIMAGLACGIPCSIAWELLEAHAENYISMPDYVAANGMRVLGNPYGNDKRIISGESGAAGFGFLYELMTNDSLEYIRRELEIDAGSRVLCISTEGDTDRENYRRIVWEGLYGREI